MSDTIVVFVWLTLLNISRSFVSSHIDVTSE